MRSIFLGAGGVVLAATLGLAGCGSDAPVATQTTIGIGATNFITLAPTVSTLPPVTSADVQSGAIIAGESTYIVAPGDYPATVANKFKVNFEEFMALNGFVLDARGFLPEWQVGLEVKIPAGATAPGSAAPAAPPTGTTPTGPATETPAATAPPTTLPPATTESLCLSEEIYTIAAGDAPALVAARFGTTVNKLNQANGGTPGYAAFIVGTQIRIPVEC